MPSLLMLLMLLLFELLGMLLLLLQSRLFLVLPLDSFFICVAYCFDALNK